MAERQLRNDDDEAVRNPFDLPVICDNAEAVPCCDPCTDWMHCLRLSLYELTLAGFDLEAWLEGHWLSSNVQLKSGQDALKFTDAAEGESFIFDGVYIAEPPYLDAQELPCPLPERDEDCNYSHRVRAERTLFTNSLEGDTVKRFGLNVNTECVVDGENKYLKFTVNLVWQGAKNAAVYEPAYNPLDGEDDPIYCPGKEDTPYEPEAGSDWFCCPILISDLIDLSTLTSLADLDEVTLNPLPPATVTWESISGLYEVDDGDSQACLQSTNAWVCKIGYLLTACVGGAPVCVYFELNDCDATVDAIVLDSVDPGDLDEQAGEFLGCSSWLLNGESGPCGYFVCYSEPIEYVAEGTYKLKVINGKCRLPEGCGSCAPDPEDPHRRQKIVAGDVRFTYTPGASCAKTFTLVYPECLTIDKVYWSTGDVTEGDDPLVHTIVNLDPEDGVSLKETITALIIDDRGCVYCWTEEVTCGCCEGLSGSFSIEQDPEEECKYKFTAHLSGNENCPQAYIAFVFINAGAGCLASADEFDCDCTEIDPDDFTCIHPCVISLGDEGYYERTITGGGWSVLWWIVDGPCGCESERTEVPLYCTDCECCDGKIVSIRVNIGAVANTEGCSGCTVVNRDWYLEPDNIVDACFWEQLDGGTVSCGPDPEDQYSPQVFFSIGCSNVTGGPEVDLVGTVSMTGIGGASWEKIAPDVGFPATDCGDLLTGSYTRITDSSGVCDFSSATAYVEITVV